MTIPYFTSDTPPEGIGTLNQLIKLINATLEPVAGALGGVAAIGPTFDAAGTLTSLSIAVQLSILVELRCITGLLNSQGPNANLEQMRAEELHSVNPPGAI